VAKANQHIHKLKRLRYKSGNVIFFCCLPDCTYKTNIQLALGKRSICHRCGESFIMSEYALRLAKPHCDSCHKPKNGINPTSFDSETQPVDIVRAPISLSIEPLSGQSTLSLAEKMQMEIHKAQEKEEEI
jgi:hypothetical protein